MRIQPRCTRVARHPVAGWFVANQESPNFCSIQIDNFYSIQTEGGSAILERQLSPKRHILLQPFAGLTNLI
jgi:hypothetical protein